MLEFITDNEKYSMDLLDVIKLFLSPAESDNRIEFSLSAAAEINRTVITVDGKKYEYDRTDKLSAKDLKRFCKHSLYLALKAHFGIRPPWGSLTGVRPTKLAYEYLSLGGQPAGVARHLSETFDVSSERAELISRILIAQAPFVSGLNNKVNLYMHIPFCASRCNYCSFPSAVAKPDAPVLSQYAEYLLREVAGTLELIKKQGKEILSVYIGGGTPSVLPAASLSTLLRPLSGLDCEITFEAGRPDSLCAEKLDIMAENRVTRVCVNPQTLSDKTLTLIGRGHSSKAYFDCCEMLQGYPFIINTDVIAGLDGETADDFISTLTRVADIAPDNITVHTLSRKRASDNAFKKIHNTDIENMVNFAMSGLYKRGYGAYYLYRQKYMLGNFENIGYCKKNTECVNNITVMEELVPVYACGAGGISKKIAPNANGRIERYQNAKDIKLYLTEFDERTAQKYKFLSI